MSYEPHIIVRKKDLEAHREEIEYGEYKAVEEIKGRKAGDRKRDISDAYDVLKRALNDDDTIKFPELEFVIFWVEYTSKNGDVRRLLEELKIEYRLWD